MANPTNFRELLTQPTENFKKPPALPEGHYYGTIKGHEFGKSSKKQTNFVQFNITINGPSDDVDEEAMAEIDLSGGKEVRTTFYITPAAMWRLTDFLNSVLGEEEGRSADDRLPDTTGVDVLVEITQRTTDDGRDTFNDVKSVIKAG
jgi:hypothetical protein